MQSQGPKIWQVAEEVKDLRKRKDRVASNKELIAAVGYFKLLQE